MQRVLAIAGLTLKAAFRFRLVALLAILLFGGVVALPLLIIPDGTARGFIQIVLTYTLGLITLLLGFATLWLSCGTLAREVEESQMQMVAVKPISRTQIWFGKLLGVLALDAILLVLAGGAVLGLLLWRSRELAPAQQKVLRNEVLVARASARPPMPDIEPEVERQFRQAVDQLRQRGQPVTPADIDFLRRQTREKLKAGLQIVPPGFRKEWIIDLGFARHSLQDRPLYLRAKFNAAQASNSGTYPGSFVIGQWDGARTFRGPVQSFAANTFHEIELPPNLFEADGKLVINFINQSDSVLLFPLDEGIEVLYREGGFALNFFRGLGIIFCWLALLAAIGLSAASFLSFPVAAFVSLGILIVGMSSGTISTVIEQGTVMEVNHDTGVADSPSWIDYIALPVFRVLLRIINLVRGFSPIDSLSTGRSITWLDLGQAVGQICVILGGVFALIGILAFTRRELATAQSAH